MGIEKFAKGFFEREMVREMSTEKCVHCLSSNTIDIVGYQKYAANFAIPFYPTGKKVVSVCSHCKQRLELEEMPPNLQLQAKELKSKMKTPLWTFSGLGLVLLIIMSIYLFSKNQKDKEPGYIAKPKIGDIYEFKTETDQYSIMKVKDVKGDTVIVMENRYEVERVKDFHKLDTKSDTSFYIEDAYPLTISEIQKKYNGQEIIGVNRD